MKRPGAVIFVACLLSLIPAGPGWGFRVPERPPQGEDPGGRMRDDLQTGTEYSVTSIVGVGAIVSSTQGGALGGAAFWDQGLTGNRVEERDVTRHVLIQDAFQNNRGIVSVNQEAGNLNNQANIRVLTLGPAAGAALQDIEIAGRVQRINNTVISSGGERENRIANSFGETAGIVGANQSAGNLNQQANVLVLGLGSGSGPGLVALGDATLGDISTNNTLERKGPAGPRAEIITDAFSGFRGIAQVNQSSGDLNIMGNSVGLSVRVLTLP